MGVRIGCGLSTEPDARQGAVDAAQAALPALDGAGVDLAVVFASGTHLAAPEATLEAAHDALSPRELIGCGAGGVLGAAHEIEDGTAVAVWAAHLDGGNATPFHAEPVEVDDAVAVAGLPELDGASAAILLADPYSFPTDAVLRELARQAPGVPVLGGLSSARTLEGTGALFAGDVVASEGAVGARLDGLDVLPCVSQGAAPVGPELTITAADGHVIEELAGVPALEKLREVIAALRPADRRLVAHGMLLGIVTAAGKPDYERAAALDRELAGAPAAGFFAAGEIGPVGGESFLHGFTATVAIFPP